ncbi:MAG: toll/interleukin-1 receptor domain-containing protein [Oscillospiraceae bacterium]|nr:toll/interleukin-1 receptor domain-containing protein [Oscillospiraceae bacterium]
MNMKTVRAFIPGVSVIIMFLWAYLEGNWEHAWLAVVVGGVIMTTLSRMEKNKKEEEAAVAAKAKEEAEEAEQAAGPDTPHDIFISYRRDGGEMPAMLIFQALQERGYRVFCDVEVLNAGKFNEALLNSIRACKDFLLVCSPHALDRCSDPEDWVRQEIAEAIRDEKNIVPIMMKDFQFPETLPEEIDSLRFYHGLTPQREFFRESIDRLCEKYLQSKPIKKS